MSALWTFSTRSATAIRWLVVVAITALCMNLPLLYGQESGPAIIRVEEDWELVVSDPDADNTAPQVTCAFSPYSPQDPLYAVLEINHRTLPEFQPGGLQLQLWSGENLVTAGSAYEDGSLRTAGETITWTQSISLNGDQIKFAVTGDSTTWETFGEQGDLAVAWSTNLDNLNGYRPQNSVANSSIGFASNRVTSLALKRVRLYSAQGLVAESEQPMVVFPKD